MPIIHLEPGNLYKTFTYIGNSIDIGSGSNKKLQFKCKCGKTTFHDIYAITRGFTTTCGKCNLIHLEYGDFYFDFMYVGKPIDVTTKSNKKLPFKCRCGIIKDIDITGITKRVIKTCTQSNLIRLEMNHVYNGFKYVGLDVSVKPGGSKKLSFACKCGRIGKYLIGYILNEKSKTCGKCDHVVFNYLDKYRGFTYLGETIEVGLQSNKKLEWKCECGRLKKDSLCSITN